ncbi:MAG: PTS sugar transporter subunit IIC [Atopobium sp.]|nr:PTS sugar transporter subunit IIC [Atopobium sp.]
MSTLKKKKSFTERMTDYVSEKIAPPLVKLSQNRYLDSLQKSFITLMPFLIMGATATLVLNLSGLFASGTGLNLPAVADAISKVTDAWKPWLLQIVFVSINLLALAIAILNGYYLGQFYADKDKRISPISTAITSMVAFLSFIDFSLLSENFDWPGYWLGAPNLFSAIIISILAVELYRWIVGKNITIKMPDSVPPMIAAAFTSMIPVCVIMVLFSIVGRGFENFDFMSLINTAFSYLVVAGSGPVAQFFGFFLDRLLWFVGLHGSNIVSSVMQPIWTQMITENINAFAQHSPIKYMFTEQWINFYVRCSVFPVALLCCQSKVKRFKALGKLSLPGTIFNIAEPIMYGLPIVLNPLMFVPWVLGFSVLFILNAILGVLGITPPMVAMVVWTMPAPLASYIGSGFNILAPIITCVNIVIIYFMFLPFFRAMEKQELAAEMKRTEETAVISNDGSAAAAMPAEHSEKSNQ